MGRGGFRREGGHTRSTRNVKKERSLDMVGLEFDFYGVIDVNGIKCMSGFGKSRERKSPGGRVNMD